MQKIQQLVYTSTTRGLMSERDMGALLEEARTNNQVRGVTGFLIFDGSTFLQLLEGERDILKFVYDNICCDQRHTDVQPLIVQDAESRSFSHWAMAYAHVDDRGETGFGGSMSRKGAREMAFYLSGSQDPLRETVAEFLKEMLAKAKE